MYATASSNRCPTCRNHLRDRAKFCPLCGMPLAATPTAPQPAAAAKPHKKESGGGGFAFVLLFLFVCGRAYYSRHHVAAATPPVLKSAPIHGNDLTWTGLQQMKRPTLAPPFEGRSLAGGLTARPTTTMGPSLLPTPLPTTGRSSR